MRPVPAALTWLVTSTLLAAPAAAGVPAPAAFGVADRTAVLTVHAEGAQVYECKPGPDGGPVWSFREPIATLISDGRTVGRHFAGPSWQVGEAVVKGRLAGSAPGTTPADIPWLKLDLVEHHGEGVLKDAALVLRLATHGGVLTGGCDTQGALRAVSYSADYVFLR